MNRLSDAQLALLAEAAALALDLKIPAESHDGVLANLRILAEHAGRVMSFPLPKETPQAETFEP